MAALRGMYIIVCMCGCKDIYSSNSAHCFILLKAVVMYFDMSSLVVVFYWNFTLCC